MINDGVLLAQLIMQGGEYEIGKRASDESIYLMSLRKEGRGRKARYAP